jgi:hypothetical protein
MSEQAGRGRALDPEQFDRLLGQARESLAALRRAAPDDQERPDGQAEALDGLVRARTRAGELAELKLDPKVLRVPVADLAEAIRGAVNAALADGRTAAPDRADVPAVDLTALQAQVEELQADSVRQLAKFSDTVADAIGRLRRP